MYIILYNIGFLCIYIVFILFENLSKYLMYFDVYIVVFFIYY